MTIGDNNLMVKKTYVINMLSGPGSGKSTLAAELYVTMKKAGFNVEFLQEYAKQLVWQKEYEILNDQYFVSKKYYESIKAMESHVDFIILDSSLLNGLWYNRHNPDNESNIQRTEQHILKYYSEFNNCLFFIKRGAYMYEKEGRIQTEDESIQIDQEIRDLMAEKGFVYHEIDMKQDDTIECMLNVLNAIDKNN